MKLDEIRWNYSVTVRKYFELRSWGSLEKHENFELSIESLETIVVICVTI